MNVRDRATDIIARHYGVYGRTIAQQVTDTLAAEGLLNVHEMYAAVGELQPGDRIIVNDSQHGPRVYVVTERSDDYATGDSHIIGYREHSTSPGAPVLILSAPGSIHVRKVVE